MEKRVKTVVVDYRYGDERHITFEGKTEVPRVQPASSSMRATATGVFGAIGVRRDCDECGVGGRARSHGDDECDAEEDPEGGRGEGGDEADDVDDSNGDDVVDDVVDDAVRAVPSCPRCRRSMAWGAAVA